MNKIKNEILAVVVLSRMAPLGTVDVVKEKTSCILPPIQFFARYAVLVLLTMTSLRAATVKPLPPVPWDHVYPSLTVTVDGKDLPVHFYGPDYTGSGKTGRGKAYVVFECDGQVEVVATYSRNFARVMANIDSLDIFASNVIGLRPEVVSAESIRWTMKPGDTVLLQKLDTFICALPPEVDPPTAGEPGVTTLAALGIRPNGDQPVTKALQQAIDTVAGKPAGPKGRVLLVDPGVYITGTLFMRDNVRLHLPAGAILRGAEQAEEWQWKEGPLYTGTSAMIFMGNDVETGEVVGIKNASITGRGVIDGWGHYHRREVVDGVPGNKPYFYTGDNTHKARLIMALRPENCRVEGVTLRNPTFWTSHIVGAKHFTFKDLRVLSNYRLNGDGLNFDSSSDSLIDNCAVASGDDSHCLKNEKMSGILAPNERIVVRNSVFCDFFKSVKFGWNFTEAHDILYENCALLESFSVAIGRKYPRDVTPRIAEVTGLTLRNVRIGGKLDLDVVGDKLESYKMENIVIENTSANGLHFSNTTNLVFRNFTLKGKRVTSVDQLSPYLENCHQIRVETP